MSEETPAPAPEQINRRVALTMTLEELRAAVGRLDAVGGEGVLTNTERQLILASRAYIGEMVERVSTELRSSQVDDGA